jgi:hypothetical protein
VKLATRVGKGRGRFFVWECVCGVSSPLHMSKFEANRSYTEHKKGLVSASHLPAFEDGPATIEVL